MGMEIKTGKFIHVIATIDLESGAGKILYVNPATSTVAADDEGHPDVDLVVENATGTVLLRHHPVVRLSSCESGGTPTQGLIQEDLPLKPGMKRIKLLYKGEEKSRFEAGPPLAAAAASSGGAAPPFATTAGPDVHHRVLKSSFGIRPEPGVTYSVQARPPGGQAWQTISVGSETPDVKVDANQFPGTDRLNVRVLRSTGFEDAIMWEGDIDLSH